MTLPILVPTIGELALAGAPLLCAPRRTRLCWRLARSVPDSKAPRRCFTRPDAALRRQRLISLWTPRVRAGPAKSAPDARSGVPAPSASAGGAHISRPVGVRNLLRRCEAVLRRLLRRRREALGVSWSELRCIAGSFDPHSARVKREPEHQAALAFVLHAMHWCGYSHPAFLYLPALHPPTNLVRWLAGFNVKDQVEQAHLLATLLTQEETRTYDLAATLTAELLAKAIRTKGTVPLLPELLNRASTRRNMQSSIFTTPECGKSTT